MMINGRAFRQSSNQIIDVISIWAIKKLHLSFWLEAKDRVTTLFLTNFTACYSISTCLYSSTVSGTIRRSFITPVAPRPFSINCPVSFPTNRILFNVLLYLLICSLHCFIWWNYYKRWPYSESIRNSLFDYTCFSELVITFVHMLFNKKRRSTQLHSFCHL